MEEKQFINQYFCQFLFRKLIKIKGKLIENYFN